MPFSSTYEPISLPGFDARILLEGRSTRATRSTEIEGNNRVDVSEQFSLTTIAFPSSPISAEWSSATAFLISLRTGGELNMKEANPFGASLQVHLDGKAHEGRLSGPRLDQFGRWEWSVEIVSVPLRLNESVEFGDLRMSGRGMELQTELREVPLLPYFQGRSKFLDLFDR